MSEMDCKDCQRFGYELEQCQQRIRELEADIRQMEKDARAEMREAYDQGRWDERSEEEQW